MATGLNRVILDRQGDSYRLDLKNGGNSAKGSIVINLDWTQKRGIWTALTDSVIALDLGCFYEMTDGTKTVIDSLQFADDRGGPKNKLTRQGRYVAPPWIWHAGVVCCGTGGANIFVNPKGLADLRRMLVYTFIGEGAARWAEINAVATVKIPGKPDVIVETGRQDDSRIFCAIAEILFGADRSMTVRKLLTFHCGHGDCDRAYRWRVKWAK
jgi:tellurite resistance protein TerA